jgi:hypothetical protein
MPPTYLFVFLGVLLASIGVSCGLLSTLYKRLASYHPEKYRDMGEPSLFVNRTFRSDLSPMKFIFKREDRLLNDPPSCRSFLFATRPCWFLD